MKQNNDLIMIEGEKSSLNGFKILKRYPNKNLLCDIIILILICFLCIIISFLILLLKKKFNFIIIELSNHQNILKQNQKIIDKLNFIEIKLQMLELNQKKISNKEKIISNNNNIYNLLSSKEVLGYKKIRIGNNNTDGGYILLNDLKNIKIAYSFGLDFEISFEKELADRNIDVFMYDHTINKLPFENSKFHWKKIGLGGKNTRENMTTLPELIKENGHSNKENMILKLDIESYEWDVLQDLPFNILRKFKYIVGEFHIFNSDEYQYYNNILKKIQVTHQIFHIHCNNCGEIIDFNGLKICNLLEISFIQKKGYNFTKDNNSYPIKGLDFKNCKDYGDLNYIINLFNKYSNN